MSPDEKVTKRKCDIFARVKNKFKSSDKRKQEQTNPSSVSVVPSPAVPSPVHPTIHLASATSAQSVIGTQDQIQPPSHPTTNESQSDLWQEALNKAQQSVDWKSNKEEYDQAILECWNNNKNVLKNNGAGDGESTSFTGAISNHLISLQEKALEKQWGYKSSKGEKIYFRDVINRILGWVKVLKDPGNQLAALDPTKAASLVWGFMQFFVERAVLYNETRDMAIDQEPIANLVTRYSLIESLYVKNIPGDPGEADEVVRVKIVDLYSTVIIYQLAVYRFWKQGKITHGIQSLLPPKLKGLSSSIEKKSKEVESTLHGSDRKAIKEIFDLVERKVQEPITQIGNQLQQALDVVNDIAGEKYSDVLKWVSPILHMDHHRDYKPMEKTGKWILDHSEWEKWRQSQKSELFWLHGKMGSGKSNLVSVVISHLLEASQDGQERVAFFYTNATSRPEQAKSAEKILRSLLKQLAIQDNRALLQPVVAKYDELRNVSSLGKEVCISLLTGIISEYRYISIIIDAFDELKDDDVRKELLTSLEQIIQGSQSTIIKIFISSRDNVSIGNMMDKFCLHINEILISENNSQDIEEFIKNRVDELQSRLSESIPEDIRRSMESTLKERSNGMFLWAHLSLNYLLQIRAKKPDKFVEYLESVPSGLEEAYTKLYKSLLQGQPHENVAIIQQTVRFLIYGCHDEIFQASAFLSVINYKRAPELSENDVLELCSTFIELEPKTKTFRMIHFSVKEFFQSLAEYESKTANAAIAAHCVTYLNDQPNYDYYSDCIHHIDFRRQHFYKYYSTDYWIIHCARAENLRQKSPLVELLSEFWPQESRKRASSFERWVRGLIMAPHLPNNSGPVLVGGLQSFIYDSEPTAFFLACQYDLREVVENYLSNGWDVNNTVSRNGPGLSYACVGNCMELASYLIDRGAKIMFDSENKLESPIFWAIRNRRPDFLGLFLQHNTTIEVQELLELAFRESASSHDSYIDWAIGNPGVIDCIIKILLDYSSSFEYSDKIQQYMFRTPKLIELLLERNTSLVVTSNTLKYLFSSRQPPAGIQSCLRLLLPLNHELVTDQSFIIALKHYEEEENPLDVIKYTLDLNSSDPSAAITETALRAAISNFDNQVPFTSFLLQTNKFLKISDETILWAMEKSFRPGPVIIELLLQHYPTVRKFHRSDVWEVFDGTSWLPVSECLSLLLRYCPELDVDQDLFTLAISSRYSELEHLHVLLSRASGITLTPQLVGKINSDGAEQIVHEIICSSIPDQITDEILTSALANEQMIITSKRKIELDDFHNSIDYTSTTIVELLSRAPDSLELSEATVYHAANYPSAWALDQVLGRWPNAPLSERAIAAALCNVQRFSVLLNKRPAIEIPPGALETFVALKNPQNRLII